jgi:hypothetical protein
MVMNISRPDPVIWNADLRRGISGHWPLSAMGNIAINTATRTVQDVRDPKSKTTFSRLIERGCNLSFAASAKTAIQQLSFNLNGVTFPNDKPKV